MCHGDNRMANLTWRLNYIRTHIIPVNEKNQALAAIHTQTLPAKNTSKYYQDFYHKKPTIISDLFHLGEYSSYYFKQTDTITIRTSIGRQNCGRSRLILKRARFNPHLANAFVISDCSRYTVRGTLIHHHRVVTIRRIVQRVTLDRQWRVVSSYI